MKRAFTLVELLAVLAVMVIVMGIAIPAFTNWGRGQTLDASGRQLSAVLRLARQHAIAHRVRTAVLLPATTGPATLRACGYAVCEVDGNLQWQRWIPNTKAETLYPGIAVSGCAPAGQVITGCDWEKLGFVAEPLSDCGAIVFRATGAVMDRHERTVTLAAADGTRNLVVHGFHGRVKWED
jgi:prepilin-type N-terminal cleavage/methylation domain-containing protein